MITEGFPDSPIANQIAVIGDELWVYTGTEWIPNVVPKIDPSKGQFNPIGWDPNNVDEYPDEIKYLPLVDDETYEHRLSLCGQCVHLDKESYVCQECGCEMRNKAKIAYAYCPINKWQNTK